MNLRLIPRLEASPLLVARVQTAPGQALLLAAFALGLALLGAHWFLISGVLAALFLLPERKREILVFGALCHGFLRISFCALPALDGLAGPEAWAVKALALGATLGAFFAFCLLLERWQWLAKRPARNLVAGFVLLIACASQLGAQSRAGMALWAFLLVFAKYVWYFSYFLISRKAKGLPALGWQLGYFQPFWGGTNTPMPKGAAYLAKIEAKTPEQLAVCRLKGLKLLYWAVLLRVLEACMRQAAYGTSHIPGFTFGLPTKAAAIAAAEAGLFPWHTNWLALIVSFFIGVVSISVWGHTIIAVCRMAGYNAFRNTYKPLQSSSLADFWNRYYYYFKELMVDVFFYPAFLRCFKKHPRARIFFATLAAAGFGNVLFHYLRDMDVIVSQGFAQSVLSFQVYVFYGLVLGTAIGLSQLFESRKKAEATWLRRVVLQPALVIGFFCVLSIFDDPVRDKTIMHYFTFVGRLFGVASAYAGGAHAWF